LLGIFPLVNFRVDERENNKKILEKAKKRKSKVISKCFTMPIRSHVKPVGRGPVKDNISSNKI
jgi:hypothetical protein